MRACTHRILQSLQLQLRGLPRYRRHAEGDDVPYNVYIRHPPASEPSETARRGRVMADPGRIIHDRKRETH